MTGTPCGLPVWLRGWVVTLLIGGFVAPPALAASRIELRIRDGLVWLTAEGATVRQILKEWERVGGTQIVDGENVPGGPQTLELSGVTEQEALDVLLRSAGGFVAVAKSAPAGEDQEGANASRFKRIVMVSSARAAGLRSRAAPGGAGAGARTFVPQPAPIQPAVAPPEAVVRLIGADGLPVPDDQDDEDTPPPSAGSIPPGFSPQPEAPPPAVAPFAPSEMPIIPPGVSTPGMIPPPPRQPGVPRRPGGIDRR